MKRFTLLLVLAVFVVLGTGFLVLIWIDMRNSVRSRAEQPDQSSEARREQRKENRQGASPHRPSAQREDQAERENRTERGIPGTSCSSLGVTCASQYFATWTWPADGSCHPVLHHGDPEPDRRCTPGGVVPGVTAETLRSPDW